MLHETYTVFGKTQSIKMATVDEALAAAAQVEKILKGTYYYTQYDHYRSKNIYGKVHSYLVEGAHDLLLRATIAPQGYFVRVATTLLVYVG